LISGFCRVVLQEVTGYSGAEASGARPKERVYGLGLFIGLRGIKLHDFVALAGSAFIKHT